MRLATGPPFREDKSNFIDFTGNQIDILTTQIEIDVLVQFQIESTWSISSPKKELLG